ncbi:MAG TPA: orotidine-5'-phosphate decarboxylase [Clostridiales bacterium]|nr:orotidine-5'-phosphate decarboxylase [Clostridiales bacterium]
MKDVIIALDFQDKKKALTFLDRLGGARPFVKVGMELFYAEGPGIVQELKERGHRIFLDLKLHDIPNTVRGAVGNVAKLGADIVNVHASGGIAMMEAAREAAEASGTQRPLIIAVTQLTSTGQEVMNQQLLIPGTVEEAVLHYARNAQAAGLDGVVCAPMEAESIKRELGSAFLTVTPGIRFAEDQKADDQVRITTPAMAARGGADYIVVGRPITAAPDPLEAYLRYRKEFMGGADAYTA